MYETADDPYCYPGSSVLKNIAGYRTQSELSKYETFSVGKRLEKQLPAGSLSYSHYRGIHRYLFQVVYVWAGQIRTVRISKGNSPFCFPEYIDGKMRALFSELADDNNLRDLEAETFAKKAAHFLSELNAIHPFREGNGRTQNIFLELLADQAGHPLDFQRLDPPAMLHAMIQSFSGNERPLEELIRSLMRAS